MSKKYWLYLWIGGFLLLVALLSVSPANVSANLPSPVSSSDNSSASQLLTTYNVYISTSGSGIVVSSPAGINCSSICSFAFTSGTTISLRAIPSAFSKFYLWTGDVYSGESLVYLTVDKENKIQANFVGIPPDNPVFLPLLRR